MGEEAVETLALGSGQRLNGTGESHHIVSGQPPSIGSLEYWESDDSKNVPFKFHVKTISLCVGMYC